MRIIKALVGCALAASPAITFCQVADTLRSDKIITNARMISVGAANILDTYLSTETYTGFEARYISSTIREREGRRWSRLVTHQGGFSTVESRSGDGTEIAGEYTFAYGLRRGWSLLSDKLRVMAGGQVDANVGFLYNTRNGNNPAQARLAVNVAPSAAASYSFRLLGHRASVGYEVSVPLLGVMFSPNYGQSYYEIFTRGDYDHNVVPTTFVSSPSLRQLLTLDYSTRDVTLRVGYLGDFRQAKVNNLKYHEYSNMFVIGVVRHFKITRIIP